MAARFCGQAGGTASKALGAGIGANVFDNSDDRCSVRDDLKMQRFTILCAAGKTGFGRWAVDERP